MAINKWKLSIEIIDISMIDENRFRSISLSINSGFYRFWSLIDDTLFNKKIGSLPQVINWRVSELMDALLPIYVVD